MLNPSMQELMSHVNNRYLLVNLAAQRARDIAQAAQDAGLPIPEKPVKQALDEIAAGKINYCEGPKPEPVARYEDTVVVSAYLDEADDEDADDEIIEDEENEEASDDLLGEEL